MDTTKKLEILKQSLVKKENQFDQKLDQHFATVNQANGQPLNDKRNGQATLNKWDKQNASLRTLKDGIEKTKNAIEFEEGRIAGVNHVNGFIPKEILELVDTGELVQWRKHPHTFFVAGVDKARIVWDEKRKVVAHRYAYQITEQEQRSKFVKIYNPLNSLLNPAVIK